MIFFFFCENIEVNGGHVCGHFLESENNLKHFKCHDSLAIRGSWQRGLAPCSWLMLVTCWATRRSSATAEPCPDTAGVSSVLSLLPGSDCPAFSTLAEQFQDTAGNDQNNSCNSWLQCSISPEKKKKAKRKRFLTQRPKSAFTHFVQKSPFLPLFSQLSLSGLLLVFLCPWLLLSFIFSPFYWKKLLLQWLCLHLRYSVPGGCVGSDKA